MTPSQKQIESFLERNGLDSLLVTLTNYFPHPHRKLRNLVRLMEQGHSIKHSNPLQITVDGVPHDLSWLESPPF